MKICLTFTRLEGPQERQKLTLDEKKTVKQLGRNLFDVASELGLLKTLEVLEGKLRLKASTYTKIQVHTSRDFLRESCKT